MRLIPTDDPQLVLLRHGETAWSQSGQYTGRTDVPLLPIGEERAILAGRALANYDFTAVYTSPLQRAKNTAAIIGYPDAIVDEDLLEWDYGPVEGLTPLELNNRFGHEYEIFTEGVNSLPDAVAQGAVGRGEDLADVAARAARFIDRAEVHLRAGNDVLAVAHGHLLRVLTMVWLGLDPHLASKFELNTTGISLLGYGHGAHTLEGWNLPPAA